MASDSGGLNEQVLELDKHNTHALHNRGISFDKLGLYHKAVEDLTEAVRLDPVS